MKGRREDLYAPEEKVPDAVDRFVQVYNNPEVHSIGDIKAAIDGLKKNVSFTSSEGIQSVEHQRAFFIESGGLKNYYQIGFSYLDEGVFDADVSYRGIVVSEGLELSDLIIEDMFSRAKETNTPAVVRVQEGASVIISDKYFNLYGSLTFGVNYKDSSLDRKLSRGVCGSLNYVFRAGEDLKDCKVVRRREEKVIGLRPDFELRRGQKEQNNYSCLVVRGANKKGLGHKTQIINMGPDYAPLFLFKELI